MSWTGHLAGMHRSGMSTASGPPNKHCFIHALYYTYCSGGHNTRHCLVADHLRRQVGLMRFQVRCIQFCCVCSHNICSHAPAWKIPGQNLGGLTPLVMCCLVANFWGKTPTWVVTYGPCNHILYFPVSHHLLLLHSSLPHFEILIRISSA